MSVFIPMQYSAEMNFSRSALPGNCIYAHQEGKVWHDIQICSPYTCRSGVLQLEIIADPHISFGTAHAHGLMG